MNGDCAGFDPNLAEYPVRTLSLAEVIDPLTETHALEKVERYREAMRQGDRFPPVCVIRLFGRWLLADGHKRLAAYRGLGQPEIVVEVWPLHRWLGDQWRQVRDNARKNRRIVASLVRDPKEAGRLAASTGRHWKRVARSLIDRFGGRGANDPPQAGA